MKEVKIIPLQIKGRGEGWERKALSVKEFLHSFSDLKRPKNSY